MRALFVTSEVYPFCKTGGLGDVSAALPAALKELGIDSRILVPAYRQVLERASGARLVAQLPSVGGFGETRIIEPALPGGNVPVWLVDCPALFDRDGGPYQNKQGEDWSDNAQRFAALNLAAVAIADGAIPGWVPNLVHANDWHAGLTPLLISVRSGARPATLFTIHNLAYQGLFDAEQFQRINLPSELFAALEFYGRISFLKAGISGADALTTVSPTYGAEILTAEYGCGFDGLLRARSDRLTGIMNGADYSLWDPRSDSHLVASFRPRSMAGKLACKQDIQRELNLDSRDAPLMAFISRLVHQKMPEVVLAVMPELIEQGMQFALVAEGDSGYEAGFRDLADRYKGRVAIRLSYQEELAHRLLAGADMLAHPARFEPCGLVPIYALRYGTIPIVRKSGGMSDSVRDATTETIRNGEGTGFSFANPSTPDFLACASRALDFYRQPLLWRKLRTNAMAQDFSWRQSARIYARLYASLTGMALHEDVSQPERAKKCNATSGAVSIGGRRGAGHDVRLTSAVPEVGCQSARRPSSRQLLGS